MGSARFTLAHTRLEASIERRDDGVAIVMTRRRGDASGVGVEKRVTIRGGSIEARYRIGAGEAPALDGRWLVQWNLALTAGEASDRYLRLPGRRPSLGSRGRETGTTGVSLVDEWIGVEASLSWSPGAELGWGPVETVSVSESGFERIYQGTALTLAWPLREADLDLWTTLTVRAR